MKDIVSIRKIRPLALAEADEGTGAALTCGDDFFLGGNEPSLAAKELFTTGDTGEGACFDAPVVKTLGET